VERLSRETKDAQQERLLERMKKQFLRSGIKLSPEQKKRFGEIDVELTKLTTEYDAHLREAYANTVVWVQDKAQLKGVPADLVADAAEKASKLGRPGEYALTVHREAYGRLMETADNREIRRRLAEAKGRIGTEGAQDNLEVVRRIVALRHEKARMLGYSSHADYILADRMAKDVKTAEGFVKGLAQDVMPQARREIDELKKLQKELTGSDDVKSWDYSYLLEKLAEKRLGFSEEQIRPYLEQSRVVEAAFETAKKLYGIEFKARPDLPVYKTGVQSFEVTRGGRSLGLLYTDLNYRESKKGGAWQGNFRAGGLFEGGMEDTHATIVAGFTEGRDGEPTLLTVDQATTVFHELGHALHALLTDVRYKSLGQESVSWDFIELPSQFMEDWLLEPEVFLKLARHYKTGEVIPENLYKSILTKQKFMKANFMLGQLRYGILDFALYSDPGADLSDFKKFESKALGPYTLLSTPEGWLFLGSMAHIISGGYSAGYYSYMWADRLVADAHEYFHEAGGGFQPELSKKFADTVLSQGDLVDADELYRLFRGRDPDSKALLRRYGLQP
jgi:peptidyl-dipeptidase Dcp